jgi:hypothetical protein
MSRMLVQTLVLVMVMLLPLPVGAADPVPTELLPPPKPVPPTSLPPIPPPPTVVILPQHPMGLPPVMYSRPSDYEVWQNLAVDRWGRFRPVVIQSPYVDYYRYNGKPYPWRPLHPEYVMPYVQN